MAVIDAEAALKSAIHETLEAWVEDYPDLDVTYHLTPFTQIIECECGEGHPAGIQRVWSITVTVYRDGEEIFMREGVLPYEYCSDGDVDPMMQLIDMIWGHLLFHLVMDHEGLSGDLERVLSETGTDTPE